MLDVLFPPKCVVCKARLPGNTRFKSVCGGCFAGIETLSGFSCPVCGGRLPCPMKLCHPKADFVLAAVSSFDNAAVRELIHSLKYRYVTGAAEPLAELLRNYIDKNLFGDGQYQEVEPPENGQYLGGLTSVRWHYVLPMPLHKSKEKKRGFNQNVLIIQQMGYEIRKEYEYTKLRKRNPKKSALNQRQSASPIFARINIEGIEVRTDVLVRIKNTSPQIECASYGERERNIAGAFEVLKPELIDGKNVILFDDVYTSGATMKEAAKTLKTAGAKRILALVIAKA